MDIVSFFTFTPRGRCPQADHETVFKWPSKSCVSHIWTCLRMIHNNNNNKKKKMLGMMWIQANILRPFTLGLIQNPLKSGQVSPVMSVGFGSGPRLLQPLLRSYSGNSPIEVNESICWYNRAHCQEDFNDIQPTFSMSSYHPITPSYISLSSFFSGTQP